MHNCVLKKEILLNVQIFIHAFHQWTMSCRMWGELNRNYAVMTLRATILQTQIV